MFLRGETMARLVPVLSIITATVLQSRLKYNVFTSSFLRVPLYCSSINLKYFAGHGNILKSAAIIVYIDMTRPFTIFTMDQASSDSFFPK